MISAASRNCGESRRDLVRYARGLLVWSRCWADAGAVSERVAVAMSLLARLKRKFRQSPIQRTKLEELKLWINNLPKGSEVVVVETSIYNDDACIMVRLPDGSLECKEILGKPGRHEA